MSSDLRLVVEFHQNCKQLDLNIIFEDPKTYCCPISNFVYLIVRSIIQNMKVLLQYGDFPTLKFVQ